MNKKPSHAPEHALGPRLEAAFDLVGLDERAPRSRGRGEPRIADIGTDHAYLAIALAEAGASVVATDRADGALRAAARNVRGHRGVELRKGSGLDPLEPDEATIVVIGGMGGARIEHILEAGRDRLGRVRRLVLQPSRDVPALRAGLDRLGWSVVDERIVRVATRFFWVLAAEPRQGSVDTGLAPVDRLLGPIERHRGSSVFEAWLAREEARAGRALEEVARAQRAPNPRERRLADEHVLLRRELDRLRARKGAPLRV